MIKRYILEMGTIFLLAFLIILGVVHLPGCKQTSNQIGGQVAISPDGERLAMRRGPDWRQSIVYILLIESSQLIPVHGVNITQGMTWRPGAFPPELLILTSSRTEPHQRVVGVRVSVGTASIVFSQVVPDDLVFSRPVWNPSGEILAVTVAKVHKRTVTGIYLGISYDNGKNISVTDININSSHDPPVWTDNETLYVQHDSYIMAVDVSDKEKPRVVKTIVSTEDVYLSCSLNGKVVYILGNEIYCGAQLLYCADEKIKRIVSDASHVAFKAGSYVYTLDVKGNVINKKRIDPEATQLIAISSGRKFVYLMRDRRSIERYNFINGDEMSTVYEVRD